MPIKVRCGQCETVLNVSEKAAGRVVLCKSCGGKVRVPAARASADTPSDSRRSARGPVSEQSDDMFRGLNLGKAEDSRRKVCPGCASPVTDEIVECPKCGVNIQTGALSERQRLRIARKGPPPAEFYGAVWKNSWKFLMKNKYLAGLTALVWAITLTMSVVSLYAHSWCVRTHTEQLMASAKEGGNAVKISGNEMVITVEKDSSVRYDDFVYRTPGKVILPAPHVAAQQSPPAIFWVTMTTIFQLGFGGWAWMLAIRIAELTLANEKKFKRFPIDFFANLTMGFRFYFWPLVVMLPVVWIGFLIMGLGHMIPGAIVTGVILLFPLLCFLPSAVIHTTQRYGYRAWLINWMVKDFFATIGSSLYVAGMLFFLVMLVPLGIGIGLAVSWGRLSPELVTVRKNAMAWYSSNISNLGDGLIAFTFAELPMVASALFVVLGVLSLIMAFPAVFMMRAIGLFGVYFKADLNLVGEFPDKTPAGFGPRFLAFLVDLIMLTILFIPAYVFGMLGSMMANFYGLGDYVTQVEWAMRGVVAVGIWSYYFASGESGQTRSTLGKWSLGLVVLTEEDRPMNRQLAFKRIATAYLTVLTCFFGFIMVAFRKDHRAMHDLMTKTKVLWRGEELT